jgi:1-deoxy-D-xylulose-5-phosphate reductoisomerase
MKKKIAVLGATGSIGRSALALLRQNREDFEPLLFSAHHDRDGLLRLGRLFPEAKLALTSPLGTGFSGYTGMDGLFRAINECGADMAINGIAGAAGLEPSLAALEAGMDLALANKETLVMAGPLVFEKARQRGRRIIPVDSEHSAIFHLLEAHKRDNLDTVILTASGGPFRTFPAEKLVAVRPHDALAHPTWNMGAKITIDSATMANKGLEVIEAVRLFDLDASRIQVVVHPQSIVHSMIRFLDGAVYAQLSKPDMRFPIQDALYYPQKCASPLGNLDFSHLSLDFEAPDEERFPLLPLAYRAIRAGALYPVAYNAANEVAVAAFLAERISFPAIFHTVDAVFQQDWSGELSLEAVKAADRAARNCAETYQQST